VRAHHVAAAAAPAAAILFAPVLVPSAARAARLPDGFALETVVGAPFRDAPVAFALLPGGRVLIAERASGILRCAAGGVAVSDSVFTVPDVEAGAPERGVLGLAADPEWPERPFVYVDFTHADGVTKIVRYRAEGALDDPASSAIALGDPLEILPDVPDLHAVHNAGALRFGPDGMLYAATGDDSRGCEAQRLESPLGKILRMDVRRLPGSGGGVAPRGAIVPSGNPWEGTDGWRPLVYAWGLRNPFRFTIDPASGALFVGNVGWNDYDEIELVPGPARENNYGWPAREGDVRITYFGDCGDGRTLRDAVHLIPHPAGPVAVTGGPVMRAVPGSPRSFPGDYDGERLRATLGDRPAGSRTAGRGGVGGRDARRRRRAARTRRGAVVPGARIRRGARAVPDRSGGTGEPRGTERGRPVRFRRGPGPAAGPPPIARLSGAVATSTPLVDLGSSRVLHSRLRPPPDDD
jgi:glucose/arabinose dehydrogenase